MAERIRLMTHNVWNKDFNSPNWESGGNDCSAEARVGGLLRVYRETLPDIIGGQEVSFELVDSAFGTYPEHIEGYEGVFNDSRSKSWNLGVFRIKENGKLFIFATTHLWWKKSPGEEPFAGSSEYQAGSDEAREYQVAQLSEKILQYRNTYGCPAIVVGDMNTGYHTKAIRHLLSKGFRHAHDIAVEYADETIGYHNCFPWGFESFYLDNPYEEAIDHILILGEKEGAVKRFERYSADYYFPISDHSPAYIDVEF